MLLHLVQKQVDFSGLAGAVMLMKAVRKTVIFIWYPFLSSLDAIFFFLFFFEQYLMNILAGDFVHGS